MFRKRSDVFWRLFASEAKAAGLDWISFLWLRWLAGNAICCSASGGTVPWTCPSISYEEITYLLLCQTITWQWRMVRVSCNLPKPCWWLHLHQGNTPNDLSVTMSFTEHIHGIPPPFLNISMIPLPFDEWNHLSARLPELIPVLQTDLYQNPMQKQCCAFCPEFCHVPFCIPYINVFSIQRGYGFVLIISIPQPTEEKQTKLLCPPHLIH